MNIKAAIPYIIITSLIVFAFANSLQNGFVWDDQAFIVENPKINLPLKEIPSVFTTPLWKLAGFPESRQAYYRPIAYIYSVLNYKIWGLNPLGFHLTNIMLHLIITIVLYRIGLLLFDNETFTSQKVTKEDGNVIPAKAGIQPFDKLRATRCHGEPVEPWIPIKNFGHDGKEDYRDDNRQGLFSDKELISLIAASMFAVHPVHNESVGRVAIGEVIFGFFIILTLYLFLKEKRYISWITFFLALLSKEAAVMLPFALVILSIHKIGDSSPRATLRGEPRRKGFKRGIIEIIPYFVLTGAYLILRMRIVDTIMGDEIKQPILTRVFTMAAATLDYIRLLIIPYPLSPFYPARWYTSILEPKVLIAILLLILILLLTFKFKKDKAMLFLITFPFIMLAPVIWRTNTFPAGQDLGYINERFLYVPAMLFSLFVSASFLRYANDMRKKYMLVGGILVIGIFAVITLYSNRIWTNNFTLFKKIIEQSPNAVFAHHGLANAYKEIGDMDKALQEWQKIVGINPLNSEVHNSMGNVYMLKGDLERAIYSYQIAIRVNPKNVEAYYNLALAFEKIGRKKEAEIHYKEFIKMAPGYYRDLASELEKKFGDTN